MTRLAALLVTLALCALSFATHAEVYCVTNAAQLRTALTDAAASSAASEIRVRPGYYSLPAASSASVSLPYAATSDLTISGNWDGAGGQCTFQSGEAELTVLSAAGVGRLLSIYVLAGSATNINLQYLSFRQGDIAASVNGAACVTIESDAGANGVVTIENSAFRLCNKASIGGVVYLQALGNSTLHVSNNTLANNPQFSPGGGPGGIQMSGQPTDHRPAPAKPLDCHGPQLRTSQ